jgi:excisionase family DNA binding protein
MADTEDKHVGDTDMPEWGMTDIAEGLHIGFATPEEFEERARLETHTRHVSDPHHVDLTQEEYTPSEVARMVGTSLEVVMQAIWHGELKAERQGKDVVCISHQAVTDWLRRRGSGV